MADPWGPPDWWRRAAWVVTALVASTAALARQQILIDSVPDTAFQTNSYPGLIRPRDVSTLALPTSVVVRQVRVEIGDAMNAGDTLLDLDDDDARRQAEQLRFDVDRARAETTRLEQALALIDRTIQGFTAALADANAQLALAQRSAESIPSRQLKDSPARAQALYDQAAARVRRLEDLAAHGVVARQELEDAEYAARVAADDLEIARRAADAASKVATIQALQARAQGDLAIAEQRRRLAETSGQLAQARLRQAQAEAALRSAGERLADLTVRAPAPGVVAEIAVKAGERVMAGTPLAKVATVDPMVVEVDVPVTIVNSLRRGDAAAVHVAGTASDFDGRILTIAPLPGDGGAHTVDVEFANPAHTLLSGQSAQVRFAMPPPRR